MIRIWLLVAFFAMPLAVPVTAPAFDQWSCQQDCEFRNNIERDAWGGGAIMLPTDTPRRNAYLDCVQNCDKKAWSRSNDQKP